MPEHVPEFSEAQLAQLCEWVERLPVLERQALILAARERLTTEMVAERLQVSQRRARRLIARALVRLDAHLSS